ncbi:aldehyde dehydrogenase family protein [Pseudonocardia sp. GCM10023141]|uniref:aldehyde dehydrogenase family protein n=1 Tax=Pseudonocardia sp. GCM10023141 TaxID=3252653 RepID=UPI0036159751
MGCSTSTSKFPPGHYSPCKNARLRFRPVHRDATPADHQDPDPGDDHPASRYEPVADGAPLLLSPPDALEEDHVIEPLHVRADARPRPDFLAGTKGFAIGGADADPLSGRTFETVDPVTGQPLATLGAAGPADVDAAVAVARRAFEDPAWAGIAPFRRTQLMLEVADVVETHAEELAVLESLEMGGPLTQTRWMIGHCVEVLRNHAGWPTKIYGRTAPAPGTQLQYTLRQPLGVVGAIAGRNGPLLQVSGL